MIGELLDLMDWSFQPDGPLPRIHGPTYARIRLVWLPAACPHMSCCDDCRCGCHAQSAQQIQMLRLLHAYIDRDTDDTRDRWVTRRYDNSELVL